MNQCGFCGRSDQPMWLNDAASIRCKDAADCDSFRRQRGKTALRDPAGKPSARRSGPPAPDSEKAAHFAAKGATGGAAPVTAPAAVKAPVAAPIRRRTAAMILNGEEYHDDPAPSGSKSTGISAAAAGAWLRLESAVESGDAEAMCQACLDYADAMGVQIKSARLTAEQILNGEVLPYQGPRIKRGGPSAEQILNGEGAAHKWSVTVTGEDEDEDEEMDDDEEAGEGDAPAPNLALTADQAYYWERLQAVVSGSGGISDSLETAARNFYNACSIGILAGA